MVELALGTYCAPGQQTSPFIYHSLRGELHTLVTGTGIHPTPELLALHGSVNEWTPATGTPHNTQVCEAS